MLTSSSMLTWFYVSSDWDLKFADSTLRALYNRCAVLNVNRAIALQWKWLWFPIVSLTLLLVPQTLPPAPDNFISSSRCLPNKTQNCSWEDLICKFTLILILRSWKEVTSAFFSLNMNETRNEFSLCLMNYWFYVRMEEKKITFPVTVPIYNFIQPDDPQWLI